MDEEQLEILREWAQGLAKDDRAEMRAAARAILLLTDEVESLRVKLWEGIEHRTASAPEPAEAPSPDEEGEVQQDLRARLKSFARSRFAR